MSRIRSRVDRVVAKIAIVLLAFTHVLVFLPSSADAAPSTSLVINEIQLAEHGTGNTTNEFVELYNKAAVALNISGASLKKYTETGNGPTNLLTFPQGTVINGNDYLLIAHPDYSNIHPDPDFVYGSATASLAANNSVVLTNASGEVIDSVRMGSAVLPSGITAEGAAAVSPAADVSISRNNEHADTDNNATDFSVSTTPSPKSAKPIQPLLFPATPGDGELTISWLPVRNAEHYEVYIKGPSETSFRHAGNASSSETSHRITGLDNGTTYNIGVLAVNANGPSLTSFQTAVPSKVVEASIVYSHNGQVGTHFGVGKVVAEVDTRHNSDLVESDNPTITFQRPATSPVTVPLKYDDRKNKWYADYDVVKATNANQDGNVVANIQSPTVGKLIVIKTGPSFSVDTTVGSPTVSVNSRCKGSQDSFSATIPDADIDKIYIYKSSNTVPANQIAAAGVVNGKTDEVYIGDNMFGSLYLVAQDRTGNRSSIIELKNDISSPEPKLTLEAQDGKIIASWPTIEDATSYILKWRPVGDSVWQERVLNTNRYEIPSVNDKEFEISVSSKDAACNQSAFVTNKATSRKTAGRGGVAEREAKLFGPQMSAKDQLLDGKGETTKPAAANGKLDGQEDINKNGIPDGQEDLNGNGKPDGDEDLNKNGIPDGKEDLGGLPTQTASPAPTPAATVAPSPTATPGPGVSGFLRDRSKLVIGLAILLIVIGTALAAYSWFRGEEPEDGDDSSDDGKGSGDRESAEETSDDRPRQRRQGRGKKRTRW